LRPADDCGRVGINAHLLGEQEGYRRAGVSRYINNLLSHLLRLDPDGRYAIFVGHRCPSLPVRDQRPSRLPTQIPLVRIAWEQFVQPLVLLRERISLLHSPVNVQPVCLPCKGVVTVTDLSFLFFPQSFRAGQRVYQQLLTRMSARRANHLITYSSCTARDVSRQYGVPASKLTVVHPGVDAAYHPISDPAVLDAFRRRCSVPDRFFLFVGTLEPRKNLVMLVEAFARFRRQGGGDHKLVLVGGRGWLHGPVDRAIEAYGLTQHVILPGYVPESELPLWYNVADAFVYPSLYEGFGLPPLEALACGTPVLVSDTSSLPEVVGGAALLLAPGDPAAWADALSRLARDGNLRRDLAQRGLKRAGSFSWEIMARLTLDVYRKVLGCLPGATGSGDN